MFFFLKAQKKKPKYCIIKVYLFKHTGWRKNVHKKTQNSKLYFMKMKSEILDGNIDTSKGNNNYLVGIKTWLKVKVITEKLKNMLIITVQNELNNKLEI